MIKVIIKLNVTKNKINNKNFDYFIGISGHCYSFFIETKRLIFSKFYRRFDEYIYFTLVFL